MPNLTKSKEDLHRPRIGIDLLGCDEPGPQLLEAILNEKFEESHPPLFTFFGMEESFLDRIIPDDHSKHLVTEEILSDDDPLTAIRLKKNSSIHAGLDMLKNYDLDAFISGGNSGALLAASALTLNKLPAIDRPGFITLIPSKLDPIAVIDVGANVDVKAENLLQFAKMGIAYQKSRGVANPTVGLLNIGEEKKKGTTEHRKAYQLLQEELNKNTPIDAPVFIGNIEGRDVFHGNIDVLVTDGFTGNVFLKTSEGIAAFVMDNLDPLAENQNLKPLIEKLRYRLDYSEYPGAILCGLEGIVMKCHGSSTADSFISSIHGAAHLTKNFFLEKIKTELE